MQPPRVGPFVKTSLTILVEKLISSSRDSNAPSIRCTDQEVLSVAELLLFPQPEEPISRRSREGAPGSEVIVFPRTNIRVLRRLWGLPEDGPIVAGPDSRAIGALREDGMVIAGPDGRVIGTLGPDGRVVGASDENPLAG